MDVATADDQETATKMVDLQTTVVETPWRELTFLELSIRPALPTDLIRSPFLAGPAGGCGWHAHC
jgi:hypothetical protein